MSHCYQDEMAERAREARAGIPAGRFRVVVVDRFSEESAIVGHANTLEAATTWAKRLHKPQNMQVAYVYDSDGNLVSEPD